MEKVLKPTYLDGESYLHALKKQGHKIGICAAKMLKGFVVPEEQKEGVTIVKVEPKDLDLDPYRSDTRPRSIIDVARIKGLEPLPIWAALEYLLQFRGNAEHVLIGVEPIRVFGMFRIFCITNYTHWHLFWMTPEAGMNKGDHPLRLQSRGGRHVHYLNHDWIFAQS